MANIQNLRHVTNLGFLKTGVYPAKTSEPIVYLYHRKDGGLYYYNTVDEIEIDLTRVSAFQTNTLWYVGQESSIEGFDIAKLKSIPIDNNQSIYEYEGTKSTEAYVHIVIPAIFQVHSMFLDSAEVTSSFELHEIYMHNQNGYYVYRSITKMNLNLSNKILVALAVITEEDMETFLLHIGDYSNPHRVNKAQIGLPNVDNTSDLDKPISTAQREEFDRLEQKIIDDVAGSASEINARIDREVNLLNQTIDENYNTLDNRITSEVATLNNRITNINTNLQNQIDTKSRITWKQDTAAPERTDIAIVRGTTAALATTPIVDRQILFNTDTQTFYVDNALTRTVFGRPSVEVVRNANANLSPLMTPGIYFIDGASLNFPTALINTADKFAIFVQMPEPDVIRQDIVVGATIYTRSYSLTWSAWTSVNAIDVYNNKQDKYDPALNTEDKTIVGAINELNGTFITSPNIRQIKFIPEGTAPPTTDDDILYLEIPDYLDGIDYMEIIDETILPPFRVS